MPRSEPIRDDEANGRTGELLKRSVVRVVRSTSIGRSRAPRRPARRMHLGFTLVAHTAATTLTNYANHVAGMEIDVPAARSAQ